MTFASKAFFPISCFILLFLQRVLKIASYALLLSLNGMLSLEICGCFQGDSEVSVEEMTLTLLPFPITVPPPFFLCVTVSHGDMVVK